MGTINFQCGCSITTSMFEGHHVFGAVPCMLHAADPVIQEKLKELAELIQKQQQK